MDEKQGLFQSWSEVAKMFAVVLGFWLVVLIVLAWALNFQ